MKYREGSHRRDAQPPQAARKVTAHDILEVGIWDLSRQRRDVCRGASVADMGCASSPDAEERCGWQQQRRAGREGLMKHERCPVTSCTMCTNNVSHTSNSDSHARSPWPLQHADMLVHLTRRAPAYSLCSRSCSKWRSDCHRSFMLVRGDCEGTTLAGFGC